MKPQPLARNPNRHTPEGMAALGQSMAEDGYTSPMVAAADGTVINGNARLEKAGEVFGDVEPIIVESDGTRPIIHVRTDIPDGEDERARRIAVRDNRIAQLNLAWAAEVAQTLGGAASPDKPRHALVEPSPMPVAAAKPADNRRVFPLAILLERTDLTRWEQWKESCKERSDTAALLLALDALEVNVSRGAA